MILFETIQKTDLSIQSISNPQQRGIPPPAHQHSKQIFKGTGAFIAPAGPGATGRSILQTAH